MGQAVTRRQVLRLKGLFAFYLNFMDWALDNFHGRKNIFHSLGTTAGGRLLAVFETCSVKTNDILVVFPDLNIHPKTGVLETPTFSDFYLKVPGRLSRGATLWERRWIPEKREHGACRFKNRKCKVGLKISFVFQAICLRVPNLP